MRNENCYVLYLSFFVGKRYVARTKMLEMEAYFPLKFVRLKKIYKKVYRVNLRIDIRKILFGWGKVREQ